MPSMRIGLQLSTSLAVQLAEQGPKLQRRRARRCGAADGINQLDAAWNPRVQEWDQQCGRRSARARSAGDDVARVLGCLPHVHRPVHAQARANATLQCGAVVALRACPRRLLRLHLARNQMFASSAITEAGAVAIAATLTAHPQPMAYDTSETPCLDSLILAITKLVASVLARLQELQLRNTAVDQVNRVDGEGNSVGALCTALRACTSLAHVDLGGEKRFEVAARQLVHSSFNAARRTPQPDNTTMTDIDGVTLTRALRRRTALTRLSVTQPVCFPVLEKR